MLALIAVLPEYAVDFTFAYKAGENPEKYAPLALANMTGGNRLLIGIGWSMVVLVAVWRMTSIARKRGYTGELDTDVHLERPHAIEITFLALATAYSLTLPFKSTLTLVDSIVLIAIFVAFVFRLWRAPAEEPHLVGPARLIGALPTMQRRIVVGILLVYAATVIFLCAEPFAESLVHLGEQAGVDTFLLVQWVAPLAVRGTRADRGRAVRAGGSTRAPGSVRCSRRRSTNGRCSSAHCRSCTRSPPATSPASRSTRCSARSSSSPPRSRCSRSRCSRTGA